ncbi:MAG: FAD-binding protein [Deltaproteobacteria bacterium]|nr:FAD-binding protein [Deltaproteobacteria bacterium]
MPDARRIHSGSALPREAFPRADAARVERAAIALARELGDSKVILEPEALVAHAGDESEQDPVLPDLAVLASSPEDVATTLRLASLHEVPVTPRAAGTGKSGGAVPVCGGIALSVLGMRQIEEIDVREQLAVVGPGVILKDLHDAVEAEGLFYPPDPNSLASCALGGNLAENAGGPRAFKYGVTRDYTLGLEVVTASGERLAVGRRTRKGVTGYDLTALLVGSEGTLAVTTRATVRLLRRPEATVTLLAYFSGIVDAMRAVEAIVASGLVPRCIEVLDERCVTAIRGEGGPLDDRAAALVILECDGSTSEVERQMAEVGERATDGGALEVLVAQSAAQRERLWEARRQLSYVTRRMARWKISEDVVVPRMQLAKLVGEVRRIGEREGVTMLSYGHAGDGNLHVNLLWDDEEHVPRVERALDALFRSVVALGGTLSGEHGIGTSKAQYLPLEQGDGLIELQRRMKAAFDPRGILNPGKIFPRGRHRSC